MQNKWRISIENQSKLYIHISIYRHRYAILCCRLFYFFLVKRTSTTYSSIDKLIADELRKKKGLKMFSIIIFAIFSCANKAYFVCVCAVLAF